MVKLSVKNGFIVQKLFTRIMRTCEEIFIPQIKNIENNNLVS